MPTVFTMEAVGVPSEKVQRRHRNFSCHLHSSLHSSIEKEMSSKSLLAIKIETVPSVKVEVVPDVDLMLESCSDSDNEDPTTRQNKRQSQERNKHAVQKWLEYDTCPANLNRPARKKHSNDDRAEDSQHKNFDCQCKVCRKRFDNVEELVFHLESHINAEQDDPQEKTGQFKCGGHNGNPCPRVYILKSSLMKHMRKYTNVRSKKCDDCGKEFEFVSTLTRHVMLVHSKAGEHKCSQCDKEFLHKTSLDRHMLTHGKLRDHKCEICGKDFPYKDALTSHVRTHSEARDHKCSVCGKEFLKRANMNRHVLTHSKARDKKCSVCGEAFAHKSTLNSHLLTHDKDSKRNQK